MSSHHAVIPVREFHRLFGHPVSSHIVPQTPAVRLLRFRLLMEELLEYGRAIGVVGFCELTEEEFRAEVKSALDQFSIDEEFEVDLVEAADALEDIDYVCAGANLVHGFPAEAVLNEVQRANMSKLGADGQPIRDEFGKIVKGPMYTPPDVLKVLAFSAINNGDGCLNEHEWRLFIRSQHPTARIVVEDGEQHTYGDIGDITAVVGTDFQTDVVGVFSLQNEHAQVELLGGMHEFEAIAG